MRRIATAVVVMGVLTVPLGAQGRGRWSDRGQGIPPGHLPPAGACRVWYDGVPPGQQPAPMSCRDAERIASRSRDARVIYGNDGRNRDRNRNGRDDRYDDRYGDRYGGRYGYGNVTTTAPYQNGYRDGLEKGREDGRDGDAYDPVRHSRYRNADHGYNSRYGSRDQYKLVYRDGFEAGYREGYGQYRRSRTGGTGSRLPWPF